MTYNKNDILRYGFLPLVQTVVLKLIAWSCKLGFQLTVQKTFQRLVFNSLATAVKSVWVNSQVRCSEQNRPLAWITWLYYAACVCVCLQDKCGVILFSHCLNFIAQFTFTPSIKVCKVFFFSDSFSNNNPPPLTTHPGIRCILHCVAFK